MATQQQVDHRFHKVEIFRSQPLGQGSYGAVFKARCDQLLCAAKLLHPIFSQGHVEGLVGEFAQRHFEQECQMLSGIRHPNVVQYLGTHTEHKTGDYFLLMELMDENLTHFLGGLKEPLPYHMEVNICYDIALAVAFLHSNGIVHRDLSSSNILLLAGSRAKITDFGMSKLLDATEHVSLTHCPGATPYMSPEALATPAKYSSKLDCFSFGVLAIQIMSRQLPTPGASTETLKDQRYPTGTVMLRVSEVIRREHHIRLIAPNHPLLPVALRCLAFKEEDRPSSQELCEQLSELREGPEHAQSVHHTKERVSEIVNAKDEQIAALHEQNAKLQRDLAIYSCDAEYFQQTLQEKEQEETTNHQRIQQLQLENQRIQQEVDQNRRSQEKFQREYLQLQEDFQEKVGIREEKLQELTEEITTMEEATVQTKQERQKVAQSRHQEIQQLQLEKQEIQEEVQRLRQEKELIQQETVKTVKVQEELERSEMEKREQVASKLGQPEEEVTYPISHEQLTMENQQLRQDVQQSQRQIERLREESQQLREDLQNILWAQEERVRELKEELIAKEQVTAIFQERDQQATSKEHQLQMDIQQFQREIQQHQQESWEFQEEGDARRTEIRQLNEVLQTNELIIAELQLSLQHLQGELRAKDERIRQLQETTHQHVGYSAAVLKWGKFKRASADTLSSNWGSVAVDNNTVIFSSMEKIYSYNSDQEQWTRLPDCPNTRAGLVVVNGYLTAVGGFYLGKLTNTLVSLVGNEGRSCWTKHFPRMPTYRSFPAVVYSSRFLVVAGGRGNDKELPTVEIMESDTGQWSRVGSLPHPMSNSSAAVCGGDVYLVGGETKGRPTKSVLSCSLSALLQRSLQQKLKVWHKAADVPAHECSCISVSGQLLAIAGGNGAVYQYNPTKHAWNAVGHLPTDLDFPLVAALPKNKFVVARGHDMVIATVQLL